MPEGQVLEFTRVTKRFGDVTALSEFSATVEPGAVTGLLGPNGAGKTTSLRILLGEVRATSGAATIGGIPASELRQPLRTIGSVLEETVYRPRRTASRQLQISAKANGIPLSRVEEVLDLVGLHGDADTRIGTFSLGMRQRLSLASALLGDPGVLVLDEPANGLDPEGIRWMRLLMRRLADEGRTVLVSSHVLSEVEQVADNVVVLSKGQAVYAGGIDTLSDPTTGAVIVDAADRAPLTAALSAAGLEFDVLRSGVTVRGSDAARIGALAASAGVALTVLQQRGPSLEEVFLDLVYGRRIDPGHSTTPLEAPQAETAQEPPIAAVPEPEAEAVQEPPLAVVPEPETEGLPEPEAAAVPEPEETPAETQDDAFGAAIAAAPVFPGPRQPEGSFAVPITAGIGIVGVAAAAADERASGEAIPADEAETAEAQDAEAGATATDGEQGSGEALVDDGTEQTEPAAEEKQGEAEAAAGQYDADATVTDSTQDAEHPANEAPAEGGTESSEQPTDEAEVQTASNTAPHDTDAASADTEATPSEETTAGIEAEDIPTAQTATSEEESPAEDGAAGIADGEGPADADDATTVLEAPVTPETAADAEPAEDADTAESGSEAITDIPLPFATAAISLPGETVEPTFTELITGLPTTGKVDHDADDDAVDDVAIETHPVFAPLLSRKIDDTQTTSEGEVAPGDEDEDPRLSSMRDSLAAARRAYFEDPAPAWPYIKAPETEEQASTEEPTGDDEKRD